MGTKIEYQCYKCKEHKLKNKFLWITISINGCNALCKKCAKTK